MIYSVIVEFDYPSRAIDERTLHKGEIIQVYKYNDQWLKDLNGLFIPRKFVRVFDSPASTSTLKPSTSSEKPNQNTLSSENNNGVIIQANNLSIGIGYGVLIAVAFVILLIMVFLLNKLRKNGLKGWKWKRDFEELFCVEIRPQQNYLQPNQFFRREQQHVEEQIYQNDSFDEREERNENSGNRQTMNNISTVNNSQNVSNNAQLNSASIVNNESSLIFNKTLVIDDNSNIKEKSLPLFAESTKRKSQSDLYRCNQCSNFETDQQEEMVNHLEINHEDYLNKMIKH